MQRSRSAVQRPPSIALPQVRLQVVLLSRGVGFSRSASADLWSSRFKEPLLQPCSFHSAPGRCLNKHLTHCPDLWRHVNLVGGF